MSALRLNPNDSNYLSCLLINQQLAQNTMDVTLTDDVSNYSVEQTVKVILDGTGRASLVGRLNIETTETTNLELLSLPEILNPIKDYLFTVVYEVDSASLLIPVAVNLQRGGSSIAGVEVVTAGSYSTKPSTSIIGDGTGAALSAIMKCIAASPATDQSGSGSYTPGNTVTLTGGTASQNAVLTVTHTHVSTTAVVTIAAGGTGGTPGTQTVTGTTGTGTKFQASVTVSGGGVMTAVLSVTADGDYTVNPTVLTAEPVTGGGLTGAQLNIKMGILNATVTTPGSYTVLPTNPVAQGSTSGSGTGATFNLSWGLLGAVITEPGYGYSDENTSVFVSGSGGGSMTPVLSAAGPAKLFAKFSTTENAILSLDGINFLVEPYY